MFIFLFKFVAFQVFSFSQVNNSAISFLIILHLKLNKRFASIFDLK